MCVGVGGGGSWIVWVYFTNKRSIVALNGYQVPDGLKYTVKYVLPTTIY